MVELLLVIRPVIIPTPDPEDTDDDHGESVDSWRARRRAVLAEVRARKTRRVRRAVDGLIIVLADILVSGILFMVIKF